MSLKEILIDIINDMSEEKIKLVMAYVMEINTEKKENHLKEKYNVPYKVDI